MDPPDIIRPSHHPASPSASTAASSVSRVNLDSFNAEGVAELRRSLTKEKVTETTGYANIDLEKASAITDGTLHGEPFDLEKVLRDTVQR